MRSEIAVAARALRDLSRSRPRLHALLDRVFDPGVDVIERTRQYAVMDACAAAAVEKAAPPEAD